MFHIVHQVIKKQGILQFCEKVAIFLVCLLYHFLSHGMSRCIFIQRFVWAQIFLLTTKNEESITFNTETTALSNGRQPI